MKKPPCKDCQKRAPGCHGKCEGYIAFQKKWAKEKEWLKKKNGPVASDIRTQYSYNVTGKCWFMKKPRKGRTME